MEIGARTGPYEVSERLGAGGMGEVYRAHDQTLGRDVALKALPENASANQQLIARFEREAKLLASLNHPNVATLYGVERSGDESVLVMELVEGQGLDQLLLRGPVPIPETLDICRQVADGLEAAHANGIIHRDLKPSNVMVGPRGRVKVLDFGVAQTFIGAAGGGGARIDTKLTATGMPIGTPLYMSPEQLRGEELDPTTDIWSFGCLAFEMLTGQSPFDRGTLPDSVAAIVHDEPPWDLVPAKLPASFRSLLQETLVKDRSRRVREMAVVRRRIEQEIAIATARSQPEVLQRGFASRGRRWAVPGGIGVAGLVVAGAVLFWAVRNTGGDVPAMSFTQLSNLSGPEYFPSLSPDGEWVVFANNSAGNFDVYLQGVGDARPINLTADHDGGDNMPAFSPDGRRIAFRSARDGGGIFVMGRTGESPRHVADFGYNPAWSVDGTELYLSVDGNTDWTDRGTSALWAVNVETGEQRQLTTDNEDGVMAHASPSGQRLAYWVIRYDAKPLFDRDVWTRRVDGSDPVPVTTEVGVDWNPVWSPDGRYLYFGSNRGGSMALWRVQIDETSGRTLATPQLIPLPSSAVMHPSFSRDGRRLAYVDYRRSSNLFRAPFDPDELQITGAEQSVTSEANFFLGIQASLDGQWLATMDWWRGDVVVVRPDGSGLRRVTEGPAMDRWPAWSPDGSRLAFYSDRGEAGTQIFVIDTDAGNLRQVTKHDGIAFYPRWSSDGRLLFADINSANRGTYILDPTRPWEEQSPVALPPPGDSLFFWGTAFSPSGGLLLGSVFRPGPLSEVGQRVATAIYSFESETYQTADRVFAFGIYASWLGEDRVLVSHAGDTWLLDVESLTSRRVVEGISVLAVAPDGRTIYYTKERNEADIWLATFQ